MSGRQLSSPRPGAGPGTKSQLEASARTTRGSVQVFGQSLAHAALIDAAEPAPDAAASPASPPVCAFCAAGSGSTRGGSEGGLFCTVVQAITAAKEPAQTFGRTSQRRFMARTLADTRGPRRAPSFGPSVPSVLSEPVGEAMSLQWALQSLRSDAYRNSWSVGNPSRNRCTRNPGTHLSGGSTSQDARSGAGTTHAFRWP